MTCLEWKEKQQFALGGMGGEILQKFLAGMYQTSNLHHHRKHISL
jgi:hypothetical protein